MTVAAQLVDASGAGRTPWPGRRDWTALSRLALRLIGPGILIMIVLVAGLSAVVVVQYGYNFDDPAQAATLDVLARNPAIRVMFGAPIALDSAGGFTVWRTGMFATVAAGAWSMLTATRITRGEEQAGRWALLMTGRIRLPGLVGHHLVILVATQLGLGAALAAAMILAGAAPAGAVLHAACVMMVGTFFVAVGLLSSQLVSDRRTATGLAAAMLVIGLLARMIADGVGQLAWLAWLTPFGLVAEVEPYGAARVSPLLVLLGYVLVIGALVGASSHRRDVGSGLLHRTGTRPGRLMLLGSVGGFAVRRTVPAFAGWAGGLCAYFLVIGLLARSLTEFLQANPRFAAMAAQAGFAGLMTPQGYVASLFALLAIPLGLFGATRLAVQAADEVDGRLSLVLSRPLARYHWAAVHLGVLTAACVGLALLSGFATLLGTRVAGVTLTVAEAVAGALNVTTIALLCLGSAQLALGWVPRAVVPVGAFPAVGGFLVTVLGELFDWPRWIGVLSPFAHLAPVPASGPDWAGVAAMLTIGLVLAGLGLFGFGRRDLRG